MIRSIVMALVAMPRRAYAYGLLCPLEGILYGVALLYLSMVAQPAIALLGLLAVVGGIRGALR